MMRTTAFPASIIAQMMAQGNVKMRGATPQEKAIDAEKFVAELERRNIKIQESWLWKLYQDKSSEIYSINTDSD